jgi:histidyl-tRNA synthetase
MLINNHEKLLEKIGLEHPATISFVNFVESMEKLGIKNLSFTPTLMRGFDYYTDIVFEIFDTHPDNRRSLFGGGRYDDLLSMFSNDSVPAIGFGMGDVTIKDFLESHGLLPEYKTETEVMLVTIGTLDKIEVLNMAKRIRESGISVSLNTGAKKPADAIKGALKLHIPYIIFIGEDELAKKTYTIKDLRTETTQSLTEEEIISLIKT